MPPGDKLLSQNGTLSAADLPTSHICDRLQDIRDDYLAQTGDTPFTIDHAVVTGQFGGGCARLGESEFELVLGITSEVTALGFSEYLTTQPIEKQLLGPLFPRYTPELRPRVLRTDRVVPHCHSALTDEPYSTVYSLPHSTHCEVDELAKAVRPTGLFE